MKRPIIHIEEEKCDGCGVCVRACHEDAIQLLDGKAQLVRDDYCDGLGACIGECPRGAITVTERDAAAFDPAAAAAAQAAHAAVASIPAAALSPSPAGSGTTCGCAGSTPRSFALAAADGFSLDEAAESSLQLQQWPVQLPLVPVRAPLLGPGRPAGGGRLYRGGLRFLSIPTAAGKKGDNCLSEVG
ncbi:MAG: 4Fe-4S binding protein [Victivallales bacterium]|nr:4Fe-4S binding protein [Victivallales bacterium]